jgi:hypothetical protein
MRPVGGLLETPLDLNHPVEVRRGHGANSYCLGGGVHLDCGVAGSPKISASERRR